MAIMFQFLNRYVVLFSIQFINIASKTSGLTLAPRLQERRCQFDWEGQL
jgi:hypothetical protein